MKVKLSLSIKLTLIVVLVSSIVIFGLTYINIEQQTSFFEKAYSEDAVAFANALDTTIEQYEELKDKDLLQSYILHFSEINPEIIQININLLDEGELKVFVSSEENSVGKPASRYNYISFEEGSILNIPNHTANSHTITVITPTNFSGNYTGTYEILMSMGSTYAVFDVHIRNLILFSVISLFFIVISFVFLLRKTIVKPIINFRDAAKKIGEGNLNTKIKIKSRDELGELSSAFNKMTSDLEKSRAKIKKYSNKLEEMIKQKDEYFYNLSHDLRTPLTPLVAYLPFLEKHEKDPKKKENIRILINRTKTLRNLIDKILRFETINAPSTALNIEDINLREEIEIYVKNQQLIYDKKNIKIKNKVKENIVVKADKLYLEEVFDNLLSNAIKYTPKSGMIIINAEKNKDAITISVKDNGIGINKKQLDLIFREFFKADESRHDLDSSGLGLPISKRIIEKHGGRIWAESSGLKKGSTFYFTIPTSSKITKMNISEKVDKELKKLEKKNGEFDEEKDYGC